MIFPLVIWIAVRWQLDQLGSHPVGFNLAQFSPFQYVTQMATVVGNLVVPSAFGAPYFVSTALFAWCIWILSSSAEKSQITSARFTAAVVLITSALIVLIFSVTLIGDPIGARFVGWIPILIVPAALIYLSRRSVAAFLVVTTIVVAPNIHRITVFASIHADLRPQNEIGVLFPIGAVISPTYKSGPAVNTDRGLLIAPPR